MATYAQVSARMLRNVGAQNEALCEQMDDNATVYEQIADLVENNPLGEIDLGDAPPDAPS